ncbi:MAG: hypothetical protein ABSC02_01085 [Acidobacteriota bacterium]
MKMHLLSSMPKRSQRKSLVALLLSLAFLALLLQTGCLLHPFHIFKHKPRPAPVIPPPARIALLPVNLPSDDANLRWYSFGSVVLMDEVAHTASDLEPIPLWESMPVTMQALGNSRTITADMASQIATRLAAKWASAGDLLTADNSVTLRLDFIPAQTTVVPFRYEKPVSGDVLADRLTESFDQFLRYLIVRPLNIDGIRPIEVKTLKEVAEALDAEYGWFTTAKPGVAGKAVEDLQKEAPGLARLLFSPTLYPSLGAIK